MLRLLNAVNYAHFVGVVYTKRRMVYIQKGLYYNVLSSIFAVIIMRLIIKYVHSVCNYLLINKQHLTFDILLGLF